MEEIEINDSFKESLIESIKKDDLKTFENIVGDGNLLSLCYGRFPILSILYLYDSKRILSKYKKKLEDIAGYIFVEEDIEVYQLFKVKAKRSLRFFMDDSIIYPYEMLAILGNGNKLNKEINGMSEDQISRLSKYFYLSNDRHIKNKNGKFIFPSKKISKSTKVLASMTSVFLVVMICLSSLFFVYLDNVPNGSKDKPYLVSTSELVYENAESSSYVSLLTNISLSSPIETMNINLDGNGKTITIKDFTGPLINTLSGSISNLNIIVENSNILVESSSNIIVETSNFLVKSASSFIALVNQGTIDNVNVTIKNSKLIVKENDDLSSDTTYLGMIASINSGTISNCLVNIESLECTGYTHVNGYVGGIVGGNESYISNCKTIGSLTTDTMDIAGICVENVKSGTISQCTNEMNIYQTTSSISWNPNVSGIVGNNSGQVLNCINYGEVMATSYTTFENEEDDPDLSLLVGGICAQNEGVIQNSINKGNVSGVAEGSNVFIGGIAAYSAGSIDICQSEGDVGAKVVEDKIILSGGIVGQNSGLIQNSINKGNVSGIAENASILIGGIVAYSTGYINKCGTESEIEVKVNEDNSAFVGGVVGRIANGTCQFSYSLSTYKFSGTSTQLYSGGICGVCSYEIYVQYMYGRKYIANDVYYLDSNILAGVNYIYLEDDDVKVKSIDFQTVEGYTDIDLLKQSEVYFDESDIA